MRINKNHLIEELENLRYWTGLEYELSVQEYESGGHLYSVIDKNGEHKITGGKYVSGVILDACIDAFKRGFYEMAHVDEDPVAYLLKQDVFKADIERNKQRQFGKEPPRLI